MIKLIWWLLPVLPPMAFDAIWFAIAGRGGRLRFLAWALAFTPAWWFAIWQLRAHLANWQPIDMVSLLLSLTDLFAMPLGAAWIAARRRVA